MIWFYIAIGGAVGSVARAAIGEWAMEMGGGAFPWWTLLVNVFGSLLLGLLLVVLPAGGETAGTRALLTLGFCGAFTTFSTFGYETVALAQAGQTPLAAAYVGASLALGVGGVLMGMWLGGLAG